MQNLVSAQPDQLKQALQDLRLTIQTLREHYNATLCYGNGQHLRAQRQLQTIVPLYRNLVAYVQNVKYSDEGPKQKAFASYKAYYDRLVYQIRYTLESRLKANLDEQYPELVKLRIPFPRQDADGTLSMVVGGTLPEVILAIRLGVAEAARAQQNARSCFLSSLTDEQKTWLKAMVPAGNTQVTINLQKLN